MSFDISRGIYRNLTSYSDPEFSRYMRRVFLASAGYDKSDLERPIVGIADTSSDFNPCHRDMPALVEAVKRGVLEAGGLPMVFHTASLHEILMAPTTMLYRNLLAMETEEMIRSQPMDSVVLVGGCDKTLPAQLMAAASVDVPAIAIPVGSMRTGKWRGQRLGACTDCRRLWAQHRAGELSAQELAQAEPQLCSTAGTCMVMGTASTLACLAEALGMGLPGSASPQSGSGDRLRIGVQTGRRAVELGVEGLKPSAILTPGAFRNAVAVLMALGGSTNALIHLLAIARRAGVALSLAQLLALGEGVPVLANCKPSGQYYMEDFHHVGGLPQLLKRMTSKLDLAQVGVSGSPLGVLLSATEWEDGGEVLGTLDSPVKQGPALVAVRGNLAPDGAILKRSAMTLTGSVHQGRAVVFESPDDAAQRIDDPSLGIGPDDVLVLRNVGPVAMGMPEAGSLPIPKYLASQGVKDMVRISDGRMSGTSYGTVVLHVAPEAAVGGPLALVRTGDRIVLDLERLTLDMMVDESELAVRRQALFLPALPQRGWARLYAQTVMQADKGCDLEFL